MSSEVKIKGKKRSLKVNAALNVIKQCCVIIFPLITFPYISRILGNDGFGKYSFSLSVLSYFRLFAGLGVSTYAIREGAKIRDDRIKLEKFSSQIFTINVLSTLVSMTAMIIIVMAVPKLSEYASYIYVLSIGVWLTTIGVDWINSIYEDYFYITVRYIIFEAIAIVFMFLFVRSRDDVLVYCLVATFAGYGGNIANVFYVRRYAHVHLTIHMDFKRHIVPLLVLLANSFAITIYVNSDIAMLGFYYNDAVVGTYSFVSKLYDILKQLINAIVVVSIPRAAYYLKNERDKYNIELKRITNALTMAALPVIVGLSMMSKEIILFVGGKQYLAGNTPLKILSFAIVFAIYSSLFTNCVLIVNNKEKYCLISTLISAALNIGINFALFPYIGATGAAITTLLAEGTNCILQMWYGKKIFKFSIPYLVRNNYQCFIGAVSIFAICLLVNNFLTGVIWRLFCAILISIIVYVGILWSMKYEPFIEVLNVVTKKFRHK